MKSEVKDPGYDRCDTISSLDEQRLADVAKHAIVSETK